MNEEACFLKLGWKAISWYSLWATWFRSRYLRKGLFYALSNSSPFGSCIWKRVHKHLAFIQQGTLWKIGNGSSVNLWRDHWITDAPLVTTFSGVEHSTVCLVASMVQRNSWVIPLEWHPQVRLFLSNSLQAFSPPNSDRPNQPIWKNSADGNLNLAMDWDSAL